MKLLAFKGIDTKCVQGSDGRTESIRISIRVLAEITAWAVLAVISVKYYLYMNN